MSTPLHLRAERPQRDRRHALAHGADVKAVGAGGDPLYLAAMEGHTAIVDTLIAHGADVKAAARMEDPLHLARWMAAARPSTRAHTARM